MTISYSFSLPTSTIKNKSLSLVTPIVLSRIDSPMNIRKKEKHTNITDKTFNILNKFFVGVIETLLMYRGLND